MSKVFLHAGAEVLLRKEAHVFERQCADGVWVLRHKVTDRSVELKTFEVYDLYVAGDLVFREGRLASLRDGRLRPQADCELPINVASDSAAKYRLKFVRGVAGLPMTQSALEPKVREIWQGLDPRPSTPPGWVSVYRWVRAFRRSEENTKSLIGSERTRGNRVPRFEKEVLCICDDVIESQYLTEERPTIADVTRLCQAQIRALNKTRLASEALAKPSDRLLKRLISELPKFDVYRARYGRDAALKKFRNSSKVRVAESILEHGEIDHTRLDVFVLDDDTGAPLGRPWLPVLIDVHSRYVMGIFISYEPPSRATVAGCLRHAFMPKTNLRALYPEIVNEWEGFGVFSSITVDGGAEFHSEELERIYFELDIEAVFAPRKTPWFKGKVERFQGTLNRGISATTPGKTFEGIVEKEDYDPKQHALLTKSEIEYVVHKWIVDVYHQRTHRALKCSPAQMWQLSARATQIPLVADPLRFDAIIAGSDKRVLSHKGIEYSSLVYNSAEMGELRRTYGDRIEVEIRFNRSNLGSIIVLHPERGTPYRVPCLLPAYAEGLTEWQHKVCKRYAKERLNRDDPDAYLDAFLEINEFVRKDLRVGKSKGTSRERTARWKDGKQATTESSPPELPREETHLLQPQLVKLPPRPAPEPADAPMASPSVPIRKFQVRIEERTHLRTTDAHFKSEEEK